MQKDLVFFKKEGEEGIALTSTSANHIANLAKEYIQGVETQLNNICFFNAEVEYYASLPIKERNRYYQLETEAAVLGKYIHPDGHLSDARKELKDKLQHPHKVDGRGRDALIYTYTPTVDVAEVDNVFFELQKKHREIQAQLNAMKYSCEQAINESTNKVNTEYMAASQKYQAELKDVLGAFKTWKDGKSQEYSKLKIVVPNSLLGIYNTINSLGK